MSTLVGHFAVTYLLDDDWLDPSKRLAQQIGIVCRSVALKTLAHKLAERFPSLCRPVAAPNLPSKRFELDSKTEHDTRPSPCTEARCRVDR